jgi:RNA polymerase sigma-70 factor (ECF subfamily)
MSHSTNDSEPERSVSHVLPTPTEGAGGLDGLWDRHRDELRRALRQRISGILRKRLDPSDVIQETHLEAVSRLPDYAARRPMPFRDWLFCTAYQRLLKLRRQAQAARRNIRRETIHEGGLSALGRRLADSTPSPSQRAIAQERVKRLSEQLARLSPPDREILEMRIFQGLAYEVIGQTLAIEPAAARKRYGRALLRLRVLLLAEGLTESRL